MSLCKPILTVAGALLALTASAASAYAAGPLGPVNKPGPFPSGKFLIKNDAGGLCLATPGRGETLDMIKCNTENSWNQWEAITNAPAKLQSEVLKNQQNLSKCAAPAEYGSNSKLVFNKCNEVQSRWWWNPVTKRVTFRYEDDDDKTVVFVLLVTDGIAYLVKQSSLTPTLHAAWQYTWSLPKGV